MTDPVDTDALREAVWRHGRRATVVTVDSEMLESAAHEVDRLQTELAKSILDTREATRAAQYERERAEGYEREMNGLVAVIENAPHDVECNEGSVRFDGSTVPCICWKADAL